MGCHTWGYRKISPQPTKEQITKAFKELFQRMIDNCKGILSNKHFNYDDDNSIYKSQEEAEQDLKNLQWFLENCEHSDDYKVNYENDLKNNDGELSIESELYELKHDLSIFDETISPLRIFDEKTNAYYIETEDYYKDNMFRCYDWNQENLHSREETLKLIENNNNTVEDVNIDKVNEFWDKYPDGLIDFG